jgi:hypothetical protein
LAGDTGRWSDEQRAAVEMTEEFNKVMSAVGGDAASGDYTRLLDVAADPAYSALVTEFIALHASGRTISGPVIPVKRNVGKVTTTADGRIEVVVTECDDVSQIERREADGSIDPGPGTDRLLYTYTLERLDALGWRVVVYEGGSTAC